MELEKPKRFNRNGRNGKLTSWKSEAQDYFKNLYDLYEKSDNKEGNIIMIDRAGNRFLKSCYSGKSKQSKNRNKEIKNFLMRQFKLLGYPKDEGYVSIHYFGCITLDFSLNRKKINKELHDDYLMKRGKDMIDYVKTNFADIDIKKENKGQAEKVVKENINNFVKKHKNDLDVISDSEKRDSDDGWE